MPEPIPTIPRPSSSSLPAVDRGAVRQLEEQLGKEGLAELVTGFLQGAPDRVSRFHDAVAARDAVALRAEASSLKGAARSFGAAELGEIAAGIEADSTAGSLQHAGRLVDALASCFERTRSELEDELQRQPAFELVSTTRGADARLTDLEQRVASLERSMFSLLSRVRR